VPSSRRRNSVLTALVCLAVAPGAAHAQGAGDEQYSDPFGGSDTTTTKPKPKQATPAPAAAAPQTPTSTSSAAAPSASAPSASAPASSSAAQLPRSGADTGLVAAGGAVLLLTGLALRRRSAADR
jgi:hypothetical protein